MIWFITDPQNEQKLHYTQLTSCRLPLVSGHVRVDMCPSPSSHIFQNGDKMCMAGCFSSSYWSIGLCFSVLLDCNTKDRALSQHLHYILKHLYQSAAVYPWSPVGPSSIVLPVLSCSLLHFHDHETKSA
jgi:hypothetical protein